MYKIKEYGEELKISKKATPSEIILKLNTPKEIVKLKKELKNMDLGGVRYVSDIDYCYNKIKLCKTEGELVYYTLMYISLRNPIVSDVICDILGGII